MDNQVVDILPHLFEGIPALPEASPSCCPNSLYSIQALHQPVDDISRHKYLL